MCVLILGIITSHSLLKTPAAAAAAAAVVSLVQVHMCVNDCKQFQHLRPDQYRDHAHEQCEHCKQRRFETKKVGNTFRIVPRQVMYWFGLGPVIKDRLFTDPAFCKHRTTGRTEYYYPSPEAARLAEASACDIWDWAVSCYEVGLDWAQMFTSKVHSTGFIMLRWVWCAQHAVPAMAHSHDGDAGRGSMAALS